MSHNVQSVFSPLPPRHFVIQSFPLFLHTKVVLFAQSAFLHLHSWCKFILVGNDLSNFFFFRNLSTLTLIPGTTAVDSWQMFFQHGLVWNTLYTYSNVYQYSHLLPWCLHHSFLSTFASVLCSLWLLDFAIADKKHFLSSL